MEWKKKLYVLGAVLLCTSLLLASNTPPQNVDKATAVAVHQASQGNAALERSGVGAHKATQPGTVQIPADDIAKPADIGGALTPEEQAKLDGQPEPKPLTQEELELQKFMAENGGKLPPIEEPLVAQSVVPFSGETIPDPSSAGKDLGRDACVGDMLTGTASGTWQYAPLYGYYNNARSESLILRSEYTTCSPLKITQLAVEVTTASATPTYTNVKIWLRKTTATTVGTTWDDPGTTDPVWTGTVNFNTVGWKVFDITDFVWDSDNLLIEWQWSGTYSSTRPSFRYSAGGTGHQNYAYSDTALPTTGFTVSANRVLYTLTFADIPPIGACCNGYTCTDGMSQTDCETGGGVYKGNGSTCTPNPCQAACCYNYPAVQCVDVSSTECTALGGTWNLGQACATFYCPPWNDNCAAVTPTVLTSGVPVTFTGTNLGATNDCGSFAGGQVWVAFTLPAGEEEASYTVVLDYCGSGSGDPLVPFGNAWLNCATGCPCSGVTAAATWNTTACGDGNITMTWGLSSGTYYYPVLLDPANNAAGPYIIHVVANLTYCASGATTTVDETIKNVTFGTINNTTLDCDTYNDFTAISTDIRIGSVYPFSLTIGDCENASCYSKRAAAYIDWNHDMDFTDAGELVWASGALTSSPCPDMTVTGNITVPVGTMLGATRMRVIVQEGASATPLSCGTFSWGATEDYTVNVIPALPTGACCFGMTCEDSGTWNVDTCTTAGGTYAGDGSTCTPNPCKGACCFQDGSCTEEINAAACTAAGGMNFSGPGTTCTPNLCPQPGNDCNNPKIIDLSTLPYTNTNTTCGRVNDYSDTCLGSYDGAEDIIYKFTLTAPKRLNFNVTGTTTSDNWLGIVVDSNCPPAATGCIAYATTSGSVLNLNNVNLPAGTYYIMIDDYPSPACVNFTLTITESPSGACCNGETCTYGYQTDCVAPGIYMGNNVPCDPNPCMSRACCFYPSGQCLNLTEEDCGTQGGTWDGTQTCGTKICPTPGDTCNSPRDFTLPAMLPYTDVNTTCGRMDDYNATCLGNYDGGEDMIYRITVTADVCVNVALTSNATWVGLAIDDSCPLDPTTCLYTATSSGSSVTISNVALLASVGTYYAMIDTYPSPTCIGSFTLSFTACPTGACCVGATCSITSSAVCAAQGGIYQGNDTTCDPNPCLIGACCTYGATPGCTDTDEAGCAALGGIYHASLHCATYTCPPQNDDCVNAIVVSTGTAAATGNNCAATDDGSCSCQTNSHKDVWYKWTASCTGTATMDTEGSAQSDTVLSVHTGCPGTAANQVACDDDSGTGTLSLLSFTAIAGTDYYIRMASYSTGCGGFNLNISCAEAPQGACCMPDGTCHVDYQVTCAGTFGGAGTLCAGTDCNGNGVDDRCDVVGGMPDCNNNGIPDSCDIAAGAADIDGNGVPDMCQPDCNTNGLPDTCDVPGGCSVGNCGLYDCGLSEDCQPNGIPDECELAGKAPRYTYSINDGTSEDGLGVTVGADLGAAVEFEAVAGGNKITSISVAWGGSTNGSPAHVYVWSDPNQDGSPADALVLGSAATTTQLSGTDTFINVPLNPAVFVGAPGTKFFVGFIVTTNDYALALDQTSPVSGRNWIVASAYSTPPIDPNDLDYAYNNPLGTTESYGFAGNLMIKATGETANADCNNNGIPDECDIASGFSQDCNNNGVPDECELAGHDCNGNGIIDSCDLANCTGQVWCSDCNANGVLDVCDVPPIGALADCQGDGIPDSCQLGSGGGGGQLIDEGFADITNLPSWFMQNNSEPIGTGTWFQGNTTVFPAQSGPANSYIGVNFNSVNNNGTISNWLLTPSVTLENGLVLDFYTRGPTCGTTCWADRLQVRMSLNGTSTNVGTTSTDVGDFTTLLLDINPTYNPYGYPGSNSGEDWNTGHQTITLSGIAAPTAGRLAFRYFVENGGYYGVNSDYIGIDTVTLTGQAAPSSNDCNNNGIPDDCDIGVAWGGHCTGTECSSDYNGNGVPDECELCGDFTGLASGSPPDEAVDASDYWYIHDGMGYCNPHPKYVQFQAADMDGDGCITQVDYQNWVMCYRMANGKDFVPPVNRKKPVGGVVIPSVAPSGPTEAPSVAPSQR